MLWAGTILSSRCFVSSLLKDIRQEKGIQLADEASLNLEDSFQVLFPLLDLLNHRPRTNISWTRYGSHLALEPLEDLKPGQPVWNNYGAKGNEERTYHIVRIAMWRFSDKAVEMKVLLGYGFCITENPFDLAAVKICPSFTPVQLMIRQMQLTTTGSDLTTEDALKTITRAQVFYICSQLTHNSKGHHAASESVFQPFPPDLLSIISLLVANQRELSLSSLPYTSLENETSNSVTPSNTLGLRHKYHLLSQLASELTHQITLITAHNAALPPKPQNQKQRYAKIYRDSQLRILTSAVDGIVLHFVGAATKASRTCQLLTLEMAVTMLHRLSRVLHRKLELVLELLLGTADVSALQAQGWEQEVWAIWLSHVLAEYTPTTGESSTLDKWVERVRDYPGPQPAPPAGEDDQLGEIIGIIESKYSNDVAEGDALANRALLKPVQPEPLRRASYLVQQEGLHLDDKVLPTLGEGQWVLALDQGKAV